MHTGDRAKVRAFESKRTSDFLPRLHTSFVRLHLHTGDTSANRNISDPLRFSYFRAVARWLNLIESRLAKRDQSKFKRIEAKLELIGKQWKWIKVNSNRSKSIRISSCIAHNLVHSTNRNGVFKHHHICLLSIHILATAIFFCCLSGWHLDIG